MTSTGNTCLDPGGTGCYGNTNITPSLIRGYPCCCKHLMSHIFVLSLRVNLEVNF